MTKSHFLGAEKAEALNLKISSPLMCLRRLVLDKEQQPIEYLEAAYNPNHYEYRMKLKLDSDQNGSEWYISNDRTK